MSAEVLLRARHIVSEIGRVFSFKEALERGDYRQCGALISASHASLRDLYQASTDALDFLVDAACQRPGVLGAWSHALALDLFTGVWIYRQCLRLNAPDWIRIPALLFTYVSGPVGLLLFILWRLLAGSRASSPSTQTE